MGRDVKKYVNSCEECQRNKPSNQEPTSLLQPLDIPKQPWEQVSMDFITHLPLTKEGHDTIMVVVDRFSKRAHFIPTHSTVTAPEVTKLYFCEIFKNHKLSRGIVSERDPKFVSKFWKELFKLLGTKLHMSSAAHPQIDGQTEQVNRILEDMLRIYVNYRQDNWNQLLSAAEFASLTAKMSRNAKSATMEMAKDALISAQEKQAKYYNKGHRDLEFQEGDQVMLSTQNLLLAVDLKRVS
ncbi:7593_t:CDS:2 [Scutellospora calospora]|uniref:7593_t:CDS:1 n=1 Tax=Scutellospora calospora TaxID=85575 RepID=A0ACA9LP68_9GLOM|nr:7593_t:CDS:2 [Scutellospora calospora]